ncbi:MAG: VPLPA-CTERM sorting domain-containing protein [Pseudomonadota bacterium]
MKHIIIAATALAGAASVASATTFTDEALYLSSAGAQTLLDFEGVVADNARGVPGGASQAPSFSLGGVTFSVSSGVMYISGKNGPVSGSPYDSAIVVSNNDAPITATLGPSVFSVSGYFGDINGTSPNASVSIFGAGGLLDSYTFDAMDLGPGRPGTFVGFTSTQEITSLLFTGVNAWEGLDNFSFGGSGGSVPPVPLPASLPLLAAGLFGFGALARRKKRG